MHLLLRRYFSRSNIKIFFQSFFLCISERKICEQFTFLLIVNEVVMLCDNGIDKEEKEKKKQEMNKYKYSNTKNDSHQTDDE